MPVACGSRCELTYAPTADTSYTICVMRGAIASELVDEIYQLDRMELYLEQMPSQVELGWSIQIDEETWFVEKAVFCDCIGAATVVRPRLTCPEEAIIYQVPHEHDCDWQALPAIQEHAVGTSWRHMESRETIANDATILEKRYKVWLNCLGLEQLRVGWMLRFQDRWYRIEAYGDMNLRTKLPWVQVLQIDGYNFASEVP